MAIFRAFVNDEGLIQLVNSESSLIDSMIEEGFTETPGLGQETSDDGTQNVTPAIMSKPQRDKVAGRYYLYASNAWVTDSDDNYSTAYVIFNEQAGTGDEPIYEWEHIGEYYEAGAKIKDFTFTGRCNANDITDIEIRLVAKFPKDPEAWKSGFVGDAAVSVQTLFSGKYSDLGVTATGLAKITRGKIDLDIELAQDSYICMYVRRIGTSTATRYFTGSRTIGVL